MHKCFRRSSVELRGVHAAHDSWNLMRIIPTKGEKLMREIRSQKSEVRNQKSEVRSQKSEVRSGLQAATVPVAGQESQKNSRSEDHLPNSRKIYTETERGLRVPFREIALTS